MIGGLAPEDVESGTKECIVLLRPASDRSEGRGGGGGGFTAGVDSPFVSSFPSVHPIHQYHVIV